MMRTYRTNICCAMPTLRFLLSQRMARPPATVPAAMEYHRLVFLRTHTWCACALIESRACRSARRLGISLSSSTSTRTVSGTADMRMRCSARNFERESCGARAGAGGGRVGEETGLGSRIGSALSMNLYRPTKDPVDDTTCHGWQNGMHSRRARRVHAPSIVANRHESGPNSACCSAAERRDLTMDVSPISHMIDRVVRW